MAGVIYVVSADFPDAATGGQQMTGPAFYPRVLAVVLVFCGIMQIISGFKMLRQEGGVESVDLKALLFSPGVINILTVCAMILFYIYALEDVGFFITTYTVLVLLMWRFKVPWIKNLLFSAVLVAVLYLVFGVVFTIVLPGGLLEPLGF
jgi:putative tricarboxylic transport membrane protein